MSLDDISVVYQSFLMVNLLAVFWIFPISLVYKLLVR